MDARCIRTHALAAVDELEMHSRQLLVAAFAVTFPDRVVALALVFTDAIACRCTLEHQLRRTIHISSFTYQTRAY